jgi:PAS domain S-box-containing protein
MRLLKNVMARAVSGTLSSTRCLAGTNRSVRKLYFRLARLSLATVLILVVVVLPAQLGSAPATRFTRLSVEQGLSQSTVQAILQDHVGFLWFGTEEGLNRYDGYTFVVFRHDSRDPQSLQDDEVSALHEDRQGRLWVGTWAGLSLFDRRAETFTAIPSIQQKVTSIIEDADGTLWVGTQGDGLFERNATTGAWRHYLHRSNDSTTLGGHEVSVLLRDRRGRLWVGTFDAGVDLLENGSGHFLHYRHDPRNPRSLANDEIWGLAEDNAGDIWVASYGGGLSVLDHRTGIFRHYQHKPGDPKSLQTDHLTCVFVDRSGTLWIGTDGAGVLQYDPVSDHFVALVHNTADPASLSQNTVRTITEDSQSQLWVGTHLGGASVLKKPPSAFNYFTHNATDPSSLSDSAVSSFFEDSAGRIWVGTEGGWLNRFERKTGNFVRYRLPSGMPDSWVLTLHEDRRGRIWIGTYRGGLCRFDPRRGTFVIYKHRFNDPRSIANDEVWAIAEDQAGALWLGTNVGLDRFDPSLGTVTAHYDLGEPSVRALLFDRRGNLWIGILGGLDLLRRGSSGLLHYRHNDSDPRSLSSNSVVALHEDRDGRLWVGTIGGGLNRLDLETATFTCYREFPSNVIYGIQEGSSGQLWLSTNQGLSRLDPATGKIVNFDLANGLQTLQFQLGASLKTRDGRILFGSLDGFHDFDPDEIKPNGYAPPVVFTSLRVFNQPAKLPQSLSTLDHITLSFQDKIFSIDFSALDYTLPRRNHYAYVMEGLSDRWIQLGEKRQVTFTNLDPGTYVLRVKASNSDGVWSKDSAASLRVLVLPPFWRTWWFYTLCILSIVFTGSSAYLLRTRHLRAQSQALARLVDERTRDLLAENIERKRAEQELLRYKEGLEQQVSERTAELSETNEQLRESEERFRALYEDTPTMYFTVDPSGTVLSVNQFGAAQLGYVPEELVGKPVSQVFAEEDYPNATHQLSECVAHPEHVYHWELCKVHRDGHLMWVKETARAVPNRHGSLVVLIVCEDITGRKHLEDQLRQAQKMEAIGKLAGGVAHDFNNLLTVIRGYSQMALDSKLDQELRSNVERIAEAGQKATALTSQLLAFSRRQVLEPKVFKLNTLVLNLDKMLRRLIGEDIEMVISTMPDLGSVKADPGQIEQVIMNLVLNARDAMPKGGKLTLETANADLDETYAREHATVRPGRYVMLAVSDTGTGMDSDTLAHVFDPFFTTKELGKGTGLGLSMVYGIVRQSGGNIWVYSELERGTTFKIYLPWVDAPAETITGEHVSATRIRGNETILLVEDDHLVRELARAVLAACGYSVLVAESASTVSSLFEHNVGPIHLLLTDVVMPGIGGRELARQVVARSPDTKVLYMSGYATNAIVHHVELDSGTFFLPKPFTPASLAAKVREVLDQPMATNNPAH